MTDRPASSETTEAEMNTDLTNEVERLRSALRGLIDSVQRDVPSQYQMRGSAIYTNICIAEEKLRNG